MLIRRKAYVRSDGTRVKSTRYTTKNLGKKGKGTKIFTLRSGGLHGYHVHDAATKRMRALRMLLQKTPRMTVWHRLHALSVLTKRTHPNQSRIYASDRNKLKM